MSAKPSMSPSTESAARAGHHPVPPAVDHVVHGDRLGAAVLHADLQMVLQIGADARPVGDHVDAMLAQQRRGADAGELQQLRR